MRGRGMLNLAALIGAGAFGVALVTLPAGDRGQLRGGSGTALTGGSNGGVLGLGRGRARGGFPDRACEPSMAVAELVARMSGVGRMDALVWGELGWMFREAGMEGSAMRAWERARALQEEVVRRSGEEEGDVRSGAASPTDWYNLACFRALCGEREWAVAALRRAVRLGWTDGDYARADRDLASVRGMEVFEAALRIPP